MRWRTVVEVVAQAKAWAPKTNMIRSATVGRFHAGAREDDAWREQGAGDHAGALAQEGEDGAGGEQRRAERWAGQLVDGDEPGHQPGVAQAEVPLGDEHRQDGRGGRVGEG